MTKLITASLIKILFILAQLTILSSYAKSQNLTVFSLSDNNIITVYKGSNDSYSIVSQSADPDVFLRLKNYIDEDSLMAVSGVSYAYIKGHRILVNFSVSANYTGGIEQATVVRDKLKLSAVLEKIFDFKKTLQ